ncbi:hypothetical protein L1D15_05010 [Vibrio sp. Isolate25]|uniref:hypothetical protein n=1 Tax=Vibrio sp. Isolate25 TaxID=2908535 RepID=UPI001EFDD0F5|nr:hypothetical protein [Vibrio sp. Isolate25]
MSATCDNLGHVMFTITIKEFDGLEVWSSQVSLGLDAEQTEKIAKKWGNSLQTKTSKNF